MLKSLMCFKIESLETCQLYSTLYMLVNIFTTDISGIECDIYSDTSVPLNKISFHELFDKGY